MIEIERKFLVKSNTFKDESDNKTEIIQGFLNSHKERTVRVRIRNNSGYLTIKGVSDVDGTSRFEWEKKIDISEAEALLKLCEEGVIEKIRYEVKIDKHVFEVDEFFGENEGLIIAEIELNDKNEAFIKPSWLGKEVTGDIKYYNSQLSKTPFKSWK